MRSPDVFLVAGLIGLVGLVGAVFWFGGDKTIEHALRVATTTEAQAPNDYRGKVRPESKTGKNSVGHRVASESHAIAAAVALRDAARDKDAQGAATPRASNARTTEALTFGPGVPEALRRAIGTTRTELRKRYGAPSFEVASSHEGSLVERYYYADVDYTNMAVAVLRNGKLVSVERVQY